MSELLQVHGVTARPCTEIQHRPPRAGDGHLFPPRPRIVMLEEVRGLQIRRSDGSVIALEHEL